MSRAHWGRVECVAFSLTPALSRWERENRSTDAARIERVPFVARRTSWPPLPAGEGWGEGERPEITVIGSLERDAPSRHEPVVKLNWPEPARRRLLRAPMKLLRAVLRLAICLGLAVACLANAGVARAAEGTNRFGFDEFLLVPLPRVSSHELGHAFTLEHRQSVTNLMASGTTGTWLNDAEIKQARDAARKKPWIQRAADVLKQADELHAAKKSAEAATLYERLVALPIVAAEIQRAKDRASAGKNLGGGQ